MTKKHVNRLLWLCFLALTLIALLIYPNVAEAQPQNSFTSIQVCSGAPQNEDAKLVFWHPRKSQVKQIEFFFFATYQYIFLDENGVERTLEYDRGEPVTLSRGERFKVKVPRAYTGCYNAGISFVRDSPQVIVRRIHAPRSNRRK